MFTIEDLKNGKCAVKNDGTFEELRLVLTLAFPDDDNGITGIYKYYFMYFYDPNKWIGCDDCNLKYQSAKDFLYPKKERVPETGDIILVRNNGRWEERIFIAFYPKSSNVMCVSYRHENAFKSKKSFLTYTWKEWEFPEEKLEKVELTLDEIADKFGINVNQLKIKK